MREREKHSREQNSGSIADSHGGGWGGRQHANRGVESLYPRGSYIEESGRRVREAAGNESPARRWGGGGGGVRSRRGRNKEGGKRERRVINNRAGFVGFLFSHYVRVYNCVGGGALSAVPPLRGIIVQLFCNFLFQSKDYAIST